MGIDKREKQKPNKMWATLFYAAPFVCLYNLHTYINLADFQRLSAFVGEGRIKTTDEPKENR